MKNSRKIIIEIGHPAHVHQFKNLYWELCKKGWQGLFVVKDKECVIYLMNQYQLPYRVLGINRKGILHKIISLPTLTLKLLMIAAKFKPDIFVSRVSPLSGYVSFILHKPHITFTDTENVKLLDSISEPFADVVLTSTAYLRNHGKKQIRYPGYHELAYLHPHRFTPDPQIYEVLGLKKNEKYAIIRFVSWTAHHDIGHAGISTANKKLLVDQLSKYVRVFISSETALPEDLQKFQIKIKPEQMHDTLNYASLFIGEGATMASECAMLGTPAIYLNSNHYGCIDEQADFGLIYTFSESDLDQKLAIAKAVEIAQADSGKAPYAVKRDAMLVAKIDVTAFMVWFVENYPASVQEMKQPGFSFDRFK